MPGRDEDSFAYDGRGIKVSGGTEQEFGEPFSVGDIIGCYTVSHMLNLLLSQQNVGIRMFLIQVVCVLVFLYRCY